MCTFLDFVSFFSYEDYVCICGVQYTVHFNAHMKWEIIISYGVRHHNLNSVQRKFESFSYAVRVHTTQQYFNTCKRITKGKIHIRKPMSPYIIFNFSLFLPAWGTKTKENPNISVNILVLLMRGEWEINFRHKYYNAHLNSVHCDVEYFTLAISFSWQVSVALLQQVKEISPATNLASN